MRTRSLFLTVIITLILTGISAKSGIAKEVKMFWYDSRSFSARGLDDVPLGTVLLIEWKDKKTVVVMQGESGNSMVSRPAAVMLDIKKLGHAEVSYRVIARSIGETKKVLSLSRAQVDRILKGENVADVVGGVVAVRQDTLPSMQGDMQKEPSESKESASAERTRDDEMPLPKRVPGKRREVRKVENFPLLESGTKKNDLRRNNDPLVSGGIDFSARIAASAYGFSKDEIKLVKQMLKGVCGIESKCNPTFVHYTPSGALSRYQGIGQLGKSEVRRAHKTLKEIAKMLPRGILRNTLEARSEYFDDTIARGFSASRFTRDPRFDPLYGSLMLMALHANRYDGTNLIRAILRTFPVRVARGESAMYAITKDGIAVDSDGTITPAQLYIGTLQSAQLNSVGIVNDSGLIALDAKWMLSRMQNDANALLLRCWVVKPNESAARTGVVCPNSNDYPKTKQEAIARIIKNSAARYYVSRAARDDSFRKKHMSRFAGLAEIYLSSARAHARDKDDPMARRLHFLAQKAVAEIGWNVRSLLFDRGSNVYVRSANAKVFREKLAEFREAYYLYKSTLKEQIKRAESLRALAREQLTLSSTYEQE